MRKFYVKAQTNTPVKLRVEYDPYERYTETKIKKATVSGDTLLDALCKMVDHMLLYIDSDRIKEDEMTAEEVIKSIELSNGDGCDYIIKLTNLNTGEVLLEGWYEPEEEDEDWDD